MSLRRLLQEWRMRLAALYARSADPVPGSEWLISIRIRILSYFLSRYGDSAEAENGGVRAEPRRRLDYTFCMVRDPIDQPARSAERLRPLLAEIRDLNVRPVPLWRVWLRRLAIRFVAPRDGESAGHEGR